MLAVATGLLWLGCNLLAAQNEQATNLGVYRLPAHSKIGGYQVVRPLATTASSRIRALVTPILENRNYRPDGYFLGRAQMLLGLLYKTKKNRALALEHLTEARRILSQFGQAPILAPLDAALAELGQ